MRTFLVVERKNEGFALLSLTLKRKFPDATVHTCEQAGSSFELTAAHKFDAIIVHCATGMTGVETVRALRSINSAVPILMVSATGCREEAIAAGANLYLQYDQWLMLGSIVAGILKQPETSTRWPRY